MLVDFWVILVFVVILLGFFALFWSSTRHNTQNTAETDFEGKDAQFMLDSFIKAPSLISQSEKLTIGEIIVKDFYQNDYSRSKVLFEKYFKNVKSNGNAQVNSIYLCVFNKDDASPVSILKYPKTASNPPSACTAISVDPNKAAVLVVGANADTVIPKIDKDYIRVRLLLIINK
jgi:hypothetical protein